MDERRQAVLDALDYLNSGFYPSEALFLQVKMQEYGCDSIEELHNLLFGKE